MPIRFDRRKFLALAAGHMVAGSCCAGVSAQTALAQSAPSAIRAIAFDAFVIFDPRSVFKLAKELFPERGEALSDLWFSKIFGYSWLRTVADRYKIFTDVIDDALVFSARSLKLELTSAKHAQLNEAFAALDLWPDVVPALEHLHARNLRLAFLSNMTKSMMRANMRRNGIETYFEFALSTDRVCAFKPSPAAYRMGLDAFALAKEEIAFAAFAGWDAAGASWFGYPTFWINRSGASAEELDVNPYTTGKDLDVLLQSVG